MWASARWRAIVSARLRSAAEPSLRADDATPSTSTRSSSSRTTFAPSTSISSGSASRKSAKAGSSFTAANPAGLSSTFTPPLGTVNASANRPPSIRSPPAVTPLSASCCFLPTRRCFESAVIAELRARLRLASRSEPESNDVTASMVTASR